MYQSMHTVANPEGAQGASTSPPKNLKHIIYIIVIKDSSTFSSNMEIHSLLSKINLALVITAVLSVTSQLSQLSQPSQLSQLSHLSQPSSVSLNCHSCLDLIFHNHHGCQNCHILLICHITCHNHHSCLNCHNRLICHNRHSCRNCTTVRCDS